MTDSTSSLSVAIVGSKIEAICLAINLLISFLLKNSAIRLFVTIFITDGACHRHWSASPTTRHNSIFATDGARHPGRSAVPASDTDVSFSNEHVHTMGYAPEVADAFAQWLHQHDVYRYMPESWLRHPPRRIFDEYLEYLLGKAEADYRMSGGQLSFEHDEIVGLEERDDHAVLITATGKRLSADAVVLAINDLPSTNTLELIDNPKYLHAGHQLEQIVGTICPTARISVLGTSLGGIDIANNLNHYGHKGPIILVSRSGMLPHVLGQDLGYSPQHITADHIEAEINQNETIPLKQVVFSINREIEAAMSISKGALSWRALCQNEDDPLAFMERSFHAAKQPELDQSVLRTIANYVEQIYSHLSIADQKIAVSSSIWKQFRHNITQPNAAQFLKLLRRAQVQVKRDLRAIQQLEDAFTLHLGSGERIDADVIINATGAGKDLQQIADWGLASPLLESLLKQGTIRPYPVGGAEINPETHQVINATGKPSPRIYAMGHLTGGAVSYRSSVDVIARTTKRIADAVCEHHAPKLKARLTNSVM